MSTFLTSHFCSYEREQSLDVSTAALLHNLSASCKFAAQLVTFLLILTKCITCNGEKNEKRQKCMKHLVIKETKKKIYYCTIPRNNQTWCCLVTKVPPVRSTLRYPKRTLKESLEAQNQRSHCTSLCPTYLQQ